MPAGVSVETGYIPGALPSPQAALVAEDRRVFGRTAPADLDALRQACQQPPGEEPLRLFYDGADLSDAPQWEGLRVELFAFQLTATGALNGGESVRVPAGHPWFYWEFPSVDGPCIIARWCHRYPGRPGVLEVGWDARQWLATPVRRSVHFLGAGTAEDAARLLALWTNGSTPPEPTWPRGASPEDYVRERGRRLAAYCRERGISNPMRLDRQTISEATGYTTVQSMANAAHTKGVTPADFKAEAYRLLRSEIR